MSQTNQGNTSSADSYFFLWKCFKYKAQDNTKTKNKEILCQHHKSHLLRIYIVSFSEVEWKNIQNFI